MERLDRHVLAGDDGLPSPMKVVIVGLSLASERATPTVMPPPPAPTELANVLAAERR